MKVETTDNKISGLNHQYLQMDRQLVPIAEYAAGEKLSVYDVEEFGKIGIVQLRKYKGKTYVVDVPFGQDCEETCRPIVLKPAEEKKTFGELKRSEQTKVNGLDNRNAAIKKQITHQDTKQPSSVKSLLHKFVDDTKAKINKNKNRISNSIASLTSPTNKGIAADTVSSQKEKIDKKTSKPVNENLKQTGNKTASVKQNSISLKEILPEIIKLKNELQTIRIESTHALKSLDELFKKLSSLNKSK